MIANKSLAFSAFLAAGLLLFAGAGAGAQEFGFGGGAAEAAPAPISAKLGGSLSFSMLAFPFELVDGDFTNSAALPESRIQIEASGAKSDAFLGIRLDRTILTENPAAILDEAWLRIYAGKTTIQGGLLRVFWGRMDSLSVLDILNPHDLSDLTIRAEKDRKIAVPMLRITQPLGERASAELVYLPWFEGDRIARTGAWAPSRLKPFAGATFNIPSMKSLNYGQAGIRVTGSLQGVDLGAQYFYGRLTTPFMDTTDAAMYLLGVPGAMTIDFGYNPYHQIGADLAFEVAGFNVRMESGVNLTQDAAGDNPLVYNQHAVWAAGFDRDLFAGVNLNLQASGKVRLNHDMIDTSDTSLDIEARSGVTTTQIAALVSRSFAQERVKLELLGMLGLEQADYLVEPGIVFVFGDAEVALRGRYFGGDAAGDLGQFHDKSYVSLSSTYRF